VRLDEKKRGREGRIKRKKETWPWFNAFNVRNFVM
jgi:hypothetical protein